MPDRLARHAIPALATRIADPGAIPAAERHADNVYIYIVAMSTGRP